MATCSKARVLEAIETDGVIPVFYSADPNVMQAVARSVFSGGLSTLEITNRGDGAVELMADVLAWARDQLPSLIVGAGSVVEAATAAYLIDVGVNFVFGPCLSAEVAAVCHERNVPYVPGCGTMTEIQAAYRLGCDMVKLFPAGAIGGPSFLRAARAPCPWIRAIPTGGVEPTVESLQVWFDAGAPAVGMGSKLIAKTAVAAGDWAEIERAVSRAVTAVAAARRKE